MKLFGSTVLGACVIGGTFFILSIVENGGLCASPVVDTPSASLLTVDVVEAIHQEKFTIPFKYFGRVKSRNSTSLSFKRSGWISQSLVFEGEVVEKGHKLASLASKELDLRLEENDAAIEVARYSRDDIQSQYLFVQLSLKRREKLTASGTTSKHLLEEISSKSVSLAAALAKANAKISQLRAVRKMTALHKEESILWAPHSGTIISSHKERGAIVRSGEKVFHLIDHTNMEFRVDIPLALSGNLKHGQKYFIRLDRRDIAVRFRTILPVALQNSQHVTAVFDLQTAGREAPVIDGQLAHISFIKTVKKSGFWLPISSLMQPIPDTWSVYVLDQDRKPEGRGVLKSRTVKPSNIVGERVFVSGALEQGELVVASGLQRLSPMLDVKIAEGNSR